MVSAAYGSMEKRYDRIKDKREHAMSEDIGQWKISKK
jgi:hypothetical protein